MSDRRQLRKVQAKINARANEAEAKAIRTGVWPSWETSPSPPSNSRGWLGQVTEVHHNTVFAVLVRHFAVAGIGTATHAAIRNCSNTDIAWRDKQRIKNELFGADRVAIEVFPPTADLVDGANMYHLWVFPAGYSLPFGLHL